MSLKSYYHQDAKEWAERIRSGKNFAHKYLEKPAMYKKLPDLKNKKVLCVGCGSGEECAHIASLGAKRVVGIDVSKELIAIAKESYPKLEFYVMDMKKINFPKDSFDFVYSSLAMHYLKDWHDTLKKINSSLKSNGAFLFSTHHPIYWSAEVIKNENISSKLLGYEKVDNRLTKVWGDYQNARKVEGVRYGSAKVVYYHNPISKILREIREAGFVVVDFIEPRSIPSVKKVDMDDYVLYNKIPIFMIFELKKSRK